MKRRTSEYEILHTWIRKNYGSANKCTFCNDVNAKRYEWALIHGFEYAKDINNFMQLCNSCHQKYDTTDEKRQKVSLRMKGKKVSDLTKQKISISKFKLCFSAISPNGIELAFTGLGDIVKRFNISKGNVHQAINGKRKSVNGWTNFKLC